MIDLGALRASIVLDDADATRRLNEFSDATDETSGKLKGFASNVGDLAKTAVIGLSGAVVGVAGAMGKVTAEALETTANIEKFSATCNVSTEEFQKLDGVFKTMGWSMENAAGDFAMLSEKMYEASTTGEGEAYEMFTKLGVAVEDSSGKLRNTGDVFNDMILSLQNVSDETERQAIASIMLGTTSEELAPLLKMTNEEFLAMKDNINVIDDEQLQKAQEFKQSWDLLKQTFESVVTELGISLMPIFSELASWVTEHMPQIQEIIEIAFEVVSEVIGTVVGIIGDLIKWFENLLENNEELKTKLIQIWETIKEKYSEYFKKLEELVKAFIEWCTKFWDKYGEDIIAIVEHLWDIVQNTFETAFDIIMELVDFFTAMFKGDFEGMSEAITNILELMWDFVKESFLDIIEYIKDLVPMMLKAGVDLFQGLWDGLKSVWNGIADWIGEKVNWIVDKLAFWKDAGNQMNTSSNGVDGSHRVGLNYVPTDGYIAELHKGEMILTQAEAERYRRQEQQIQQVNNIFDTSSLESKIDKLTKIVDKIPNKIQINANMA